MHTKLFYQTRSSTQIKLRSKKWNINSGSKRITGETCSPSSIIWQQTNIGDSASVIGRPSTVTCLIVEWFGQLTWLAGASPVARSRASNALFRLQQHTSLVYTGWTPDLSEDELCNMTRDTQSSPGALWSTNTRPRVNDVRICVLLSYAFSSRLVRVIKYPIHPLKT